MNSHLKELEERIAYEFKNKNLFTQALTHSSYANEHRLDHSRCNERLEFLGDAVLEIVTSEFLYRKYETLPEGDLTKSGPALCANPPWLTAQGTLSWANTCIWARVRMPPAAGTAIPWCQTPWRP